jgi:hypothetical protein
MAPQPRTRRRSARKTSSKKKSAPKKSAPKKSDPLPKIDSVPHGRTIKSSIRAIIQEVVNDEPLTVRDALRRGLAADPKVAHHYLKLAAEYIDGKPDQNLRHSFDVDELAQAKDTLGQKLDAVLATLTRTDGRS